MNVLHINIVTCVFIIKIVCALIDVTHILVYRACLEYVANTCGSWLLMKGAPLATIRSCRLQDLMVLVIF